MQLQEEKRLSAYLNEAVYSVEGIMEALSAEEVASADVEQHRLEALIGALPPSKFNYLKEVLETEFKERFAQLHQYGLLTMELLNLITYCDPVFEGLGFTEEDQYLRYAIVGTVGDYFEEQEEVKEV